MEEGPVPNEVKDVLSTLHEEHACLNKYLDVIRKYLADDPIKNCNSLISYICNNVKSSEVENSLSSYISELVEHIQVANAIDFVKGGNTKESIEVSINKKQEENEKLGGYGEKDSGQNKGENETKFEANRENEKNEEGNIKHGNVHREGNGRKIGEEHEQQHGDEHKEQHEEEHDNVDISSDQLFCAEYRIQMKDEKLNKYKAPDYRKDLLKSCTKNVNYLKLLYTISDKVLSKVGYVFFLNIIHGHNVSYQYKLVSLEYFAHCANRIKSNRAKYIAQILPTLLEKFYSVEGEPYYNDNINDVDLLIGISRFVAVLCDESIKHQEDDQQEVALYSIVAFIMRIVYYHSNFLPLNKNVEQLFKHIHYSAINYEECLQIYKNIDENLYKTKNELIIKKCLSSLIWKLSIINPDLPKTLEKVNILIPNTETCVLENSTVELSVVSYLILIQKINKEAFPLVYSELYLFNLMMRNSFNLILCVPISKEHKKLKLLLRAYHFISVAVFLSKIIEKEEKQAFSNIYNFKWRPIDFLTKIYQILPQYNHFHNYTTVIYNCICNIMRSFHWDVFFHIYSKIISNCENDLIKGTAAAYFKDELFKQLCTVVQQIKDMKKETEMNHSSEECLQLEQNIDALVDKTGKQLKKIVFILLGEDSVALYFNSILVVLNVIKMILLNKRFEPFYKYLIDIEDPSKCFLQNKLQYFLDQIKIERHVLQNTDQSEKSISTTDSLSGYNSNISNAVGNNNFNDAIQKKADKNSINNLSENGLYLVTFLLEDIEKAIKRIKLKET